MVGPKYIVNAVLHRFGYHVSSVEEAHHDPVIDADKQFLSIYESCKPYSMTSKLRCYALYTAVRYIVDAGIPGDFVECGVWRGGSTMLIAKTLLFLNVLDRKIYLYDTFEGMAEPTDADYAVRDPHIDARVEWQRHQSGSHNAWCYATLDDVRQNMEMTGYPTDQLVFTKGKVEDTIPAVAPERIALLRLDTDWYESTRHELQQLYPRVIPQGVLIIDDYGSWAGAKKAVDEYFQHNPVLLHRVDNSCRMVVKANS